MIRPVKMLQDDTQGETAIVCGILVRGAVLFTKGGNGVASNAMTLLRGNWQPGFIKADGSYIWIGKFKHQIRVVDHFAANLSLPLWETHTGVNRIFERIGKHNSKLRLVHG